MRVLWFSGRSCVGIVRVVSQYEGIQYYIGCPPGEAKGYNEEEDTQWIADWGARFPGEVGDILFGADPLRNGEAVQVPLNKEQAEMMIRVGQSLLGAKMKYSRDLILQVREFMERHCDAFEIAHRIGIDPNDVLAIIEIIKQVVT